MRDRIMTQRKIKIFILLFLIFFLSNGYAKSPESTRMFPEQIKVSIDFLWQNLIQIHPNGPALETRLKTQMEEAKSRATDPMSAGEFYLLIAPLVSKVNDGHTNLAFQFDFADIRYFPMDLSFIGDKVYVLKDYTPEHRGEPEIQLMAISNTPIDSIRKELFTIVPGETRSFKQRGLDSDLFKVLYHLLNPNDTDVKLILRSFGQETYERKIKFLQREEIKAQRSEVPANGLKLTLNTTLAVMNIHTFDEKDIGSFFSRSFKQLQKKQIKYLIIDIRDNLGGNLSNMETLLSYLISKPIWPFKGFQVRTSRQFKKLAKTRIPKLFRWLPLERLDKRGRAIWNAAEGSLVTIPESKPIIPKEPDKRFSGKTIVLINGHTYSAASLFAHFIQKYNLGRIAGEESGGLAGYSYGEALQIPLPHSPITLNVSSLLILVRDMKKNSHGIIPDIPIERDIAEEVAGLDSQMEKIRDLIKRYN